MRHLLNTLFVLTEDSYLSLDGENIVISNGENTIGRFPLHVLEGVLYFGYRGASPSLMGACAQRGINLVFMKPSGRFLARVSGETRGNVLLRKKQFRVSELSDESLTIARSFVMGKVYNSRWVLERAIRDHTLQVDVEKLKATSTRLRGFLPEIASVGSVDSLRGLEGEAASMYFGVLNELILRDKDNFFFYGRNRRPPRDNVNTMLSFFYSILANDCTAALESVGLDPYIGFMHSDRPGRAALALDLMEELRSVIADRFVLTLINNRVVSATDFVQQENSTVTLSDDGRKAALSAWQGRKKETITHPFLGEKIPWGLVPYVQALLLARYLRGDLDAYPTFFWK